MLRFAIVPIYVLILFSCTTNSSKGLVFDRSSSELLKTVQEQEYIIDNSKDTVIACDQGTRITINRGTFNVPIVKISIKEFFNLPDFIANGLSTVSDYSVLESDGMLFIRATDFNDVELSLNTDCSIGVEIPLTKSDMMLFYGQMDDNNLINWEKASLLTDDRISDSSESVDVELGTLGTNQEYSIFESARLGWINADQFLNIKEKEDLIVKVPSSSAKYSLVLYNFNSLLVGVPDKTGTIIFQDLPKGEKVTLIGLGEKDGQLYESFSNYTIGSIGEKRATEFTKSTMGELKDKLHKKFGDDLASRPRAKF